MFYIHTLGLICIATYYRMRKYVGSLNVLHFLPYVLSRLSVAMRQIRCGILLHDRCEVPSYVKVAP
jgi:hypothetical protein